MTFTRIILKHFLLHAYALLSNTLFVISHIFPKSIAQHACRMEMKFFRLNPKFMHRLLTAAFQKFICGDLCHNYLHTRYTFACFNKHILCLMFVFFLPLREYYITIWIVLAGFLYLFFNYGNVGYILANQSDISKLFFKLWGNDESSKENYDGHLRCLVYRAL